MKKILIPVFSFSPSGGVRVFTYLANEWRKLGHDVTMVAYCGISKPYYPVKCKVLYLDIQGRETNQNINTSKKASWGKCFIALLRYVKRNSHKFDVIVGTYNPTAYVISLASKVKNYYYIQAYEAEFFNRGIRGIVLKVIAWGSYFLPLKKIVNAEIYKKYKNLSSKDVIPPGLDLSNYYPKQLINDNKKVLTVGCIGRTEEWKGAHDVGEAIRILHKRGYLNKIKLKVAFNKVNYENHELVQPHGDENLANYYRSLDVLVAPGHIQLGAVHYPVIEAMACNVPVITTGYYPANTNNSFIVSIKNPEEIASIIEKIYKNYSKVTEKCMIAQQDIQEFDWSIVSQKFIDIFEE